MSYRLQIKPSAEKELQAIAQTVRQRIQRAIRKLGDDPRPPRRTEIGQPARMATAGRPVPNHLRH